MAYAGDSWLVPSHSGVCSVVLLVYIHPYTELTFPSSHSLAPPVPLKTSLVWATPVLHPVEEVLSAHDTVARTKSSFERWFSRAHEGGALEPGYLGWNPINPFHDLERTIYLCFWFFFCEKWVIVKVPSYNKMGLLWVEGVSTWKVYG